MATSLKRTREAVETSQSPAHSIQKRELTPSTKDANDAEEGTADPNLTENYDDDDDDEDDEDKVIRQYFVDLADAMQFVADFITEQLTLLRDISQRLTRKQTNAFLTEFRRRSFDADILWFKQAAERAEVEGRVIYTIWEEYLHERRGAEAKEDERKAGGNEAKTSGDEAKTAEDETKTSGDETKKADGDSQSATPGPQPQPKESEEADLSHDANGSLQPRPRPPILGADILWFAHAVKRARAEGRQLGTIWDEYPWELSEEADTVVHKEADPVKKSRARASEPDGTPPSKRQRTDASA